MELKLTIAWADFVNKANELTEEGQLIVAKEKSVLTEDDYGLVKDEMKNWREKTNSFLIACFAQDRHPIAHEIYYAGSQRYTGNLPKGWEQKKKEAFEDFRYKLATLAYYVKLLGACDMVARPESTIVSERSTYTTGETLDLILEKLYDLYDDATYSIKYLVVGNGIPLKREHEEREFARLLEQSGYIDMGHGREVAAQLSTTGRLYVEEKRKVYIENYSTISSDAAEIDARVDEILERLTNLGYGQEIIFNEIDELKELYKTLNKKNWGQVVKGKLIDLSLGKLVENDTLKWAYEALTDHKLHLP